MGNLSKKLHLVRDRCTAVAGGLQDGLHRTAPADGQVVHASCATWKASHVSLPTSCATADHRKGLFLTCRCAGTRPRSLLRTWNG